MNQDREPELGDLIELFRKGYKHWAIYVGEGYVIHVVKNPGNFGKATVKKEKLQDVVGNDKYRINNHLDPSDQFYRRPIEVILPEAESFVGVELTYNVATSNCEHFVTLLRYGKPQSQQVKLAKHKIAALITAAGVFGII